MKASQKFIAEDITAQLKTKMSLKADMLKDIQR